MTGAGRISIGVSGWTYALWRGHFYPRGLRQKDELAFAAAALSGLEINGTHYGMQTPESFRRWAAAVPENFLFAVKAPQFVTHRLRLRRAETAIANFYASGLLALGEKLGPILWQFPPSFRFDPESFAPFLAGLPQDSEALAAQAGFHDHRLKAPPCLEPGRRRRVRHAVEIRHESFRDPAFVALLARHDVALVCADTVAWPRLMDQTADFAYCRLHGSRELYLNRYEDAEIEAWARRVEAWAGGRPMTDGAFAAAPETDPPPRDVFVYFDNTDKLHAPDDARALMRRLGVPPAGDTDAFTNR